MMIKCPECGKEVSDKAASCPNCGCPIQESSKNENQNFTETSQQIPLQPLPLPQPQPQPFQQIPNTPRPDPFTNDKNSGLGIAALVLSILGCTFWLGIILAVIDLLKRDGRKKTCAIIAIIISVVWIFLGAGIFGGGDNQDEAGEKEVTEETVKLEESEKVKEKKLEKQKDEDEVKKEVFPMMELWDDNDCKISVTGGDKEKINFLIENNGTKDLSFNVHSMSINGIMTECNIYTMRTDIPSGKKANAELDISDYTDKTETVEYVEVLFWVYDNAKSYKDFETGILKIESSLFNNGSYLEDTVNKKELERIDISLKELGNEKFSIIVTNKGESYIDVDVENLSFDGWAYDTGLSLFDVEIFPNSQVEMSMDIDDDFLKNNSIEEVTNCEFSLKIREKGDYFQEQETEKIIFEK